MDLSNTSCRTALTLALALPLGSLASLTAAELEYSTLFSGAIAEVIEDVAIDSDGSLVLVGSSSSPDLYGALSRSDCDGEQGACAEADAFVVRLSPDAREVLSGRFLGGSGYDEGLGVTIGADGSVYVVGSTTSSDFPTLAAAQGHLGRDPSASMGEDTPSDAFVTKLDRDLETMVWSTYLGGGEVDAALDVAVSSEGRVMVVGKTEGDFHVTEFGFDFSFNGRTDAFVAWLHESGALVHGFYVGGPERDEALAVVVDESDRFWVAGTAGRGLPTPAGAYSEGVDGPSDAWVARIDPTLLGRNIVQECTYLGGGGFDHASTLAVGAEGAVYVAGRTGSTDLPTTRAAYLEACDCNSSSTAGTDGFVAEFSDDLSTLEWATYLGGSEGDEASSIAVDALGRVWVTGRASRTFPVEPSDAPAVEDEEGDAFVAVVSATGRTLSSSRGLGGRAGGFFISGPRDWGTALAMDSEGDAIVVGVTWASDFPTTSGALTVESNDRIRFGHFDSWLARLGKGSAEELAAALIREIVADPDLGPLETRALARLVEVAEIAFQRSDLDEANDRLIEFIGQTESLAIGQILDAAIAQYFVDLARELLTTMAEEIDEGPAFVRGDCNGDGSVGGSVTDIIFLLSWTFASGEEPPCLAACDVDANGSVSSPIGDAVYYATWTFLGGPQPGAPYPLCGALSVADQSIGCERATADCSR